MQITIRNTAVLSFGLALSAWGAPALAEDDGDWSIKPRGRLQIDAGWVDANDAVETAADAVTRGGLAWDVEARRAYLGVDGTMPGNLGFRIEGEFAGVIEGGSASWTDAYLYWDANRQLRLTLGNQKPFWGLEELTSDLFPSMAERAAFNAAFGHERRTGLSAVWKSGDWLLQGGAFADDLDAIMGDNARGHSFDGRAVFAPGLAGGRLHLGASAHYRDLGNPVGVRYSARPFIHTADTRFANTGTIADATAETGYGLEFAWIKGPLHLTGETRWQHVSRSGALVEPTFFGAYAEVGYFLTRGDTRGYKGGAFDRTTPAHPLGKGGIGAVQVNLRYDWLDLADKGIAGGTQGSWSGSLVWTPTSRTRFIIDYARLRFEGSPIAVGTPNAYGANAFGMRAQFDF